MKRKGTETRKSRIYETLSGKVYGTDGVPQRPSGDRPVYSVPKLTPQEAARRLSLRICGVSGRRCEEHVGRPGCGRILLIRSELAGNASIAK